ncbi:MULTISPECIES: FtsX-like permease family protein [unclassified Clostridioides]|uniref:FtsX-like permease family protein n=1 Tax=unclassified Clostridioides TaxID=2635829 RepID=UPI001D11EA60|nr:ABC transporter permease [Clostridioides sp. ES-S-0171-01]MCC0688734.1 ABC transporter permease [Clostridioides sp. ES-S-0056-01]MCC0716392.1 ABC transporter permease [Clostridioides sp. ES-S-0077-01]UDN54116.1 ABC transporter permease [Clostridioides sp. ES-S-0054-01]
MSILGIAYNNFKSNIRTYLAFFISMVFSVVVLINFELLRYGDAINVLQGENKRFTLSVLVAVIMILSVFLFFFIWYATNIFFKNRSKEIGILSFMGLDLYTIGKIYFVENMLIGISSCITGIIIGIITSRFFQVVIIKLSGFDIKVSNGLSIEAILYATLIFISIFIIMAIKGFITICRSSVINLINTSKKQEKIPKIGIGIYILAMISIIVIGYGYYLSTNIRTGNITSVIPIIGIIIIGTYGLFKSVVPVIFDIIIKNKKILFNGNNIIAINNINYRLNKNYKTYAIIAIIITTTISTLGASVAMNYVYKNAKEQRNIYTVSIVSMNKDEVNKKQIENIIKDTNKIKYSVNPELTVLEKTDSKETYDTTDAIMKYSDFCNILKVNGNGEELKEYSEKLVRGNSVIELKSPQTIVSMATKEANIKLDGQLYSISKGGVKVPVLGTGFNKSIIVVNDNAYFKLRDKGQQVYFYGAKVSQEEDSQVMFSNIEKNLSLKNGYIMNGYKGLNEGQWMKFAYVVLVFLFLVFAIVAGSIIYMKIYNDAYEDKDKYKILLKIGTTEKEINRAILKEVAIFYTLPMLSATISSYFALRLAGDLLMANLFGIYILSLVICLIIFIIYGAVSVNKFKSVVYKN